MSWPWQRIDDPYERPVPVAFTERLKVLLMGGSVVVSCLWFAARAGDQRDEGAAALVALGASVAAIHVIQLVYLRRTGPSGRIFISSERIAAIVYSMAVVGGVAAAIVGLANGA